MRVLFFILLLVFACTPSTKKQLTIATAASVQFAMEEVAKVYEDKYDVHCEIILGSSGQLNAQVKAGAPYDVFVSANLKYANDLYENNFTLNQPQTYGYGVLVLWFIDSVDSLSIHSLLNDNLKKIAIANPNTAPYGEAALQSLSNLNIRETIESKLVYGESISQVNQFVKSKAVDCGFTSKSVVIAPELDSLGSWIEVDENLYAPMAQAVVVLKGDNEKEATQFFDFLLSGDGKSILTKYGYKVP